jgi:hypothetical protein
MLAIPRLNRLNAKGMGFQTLDKYCLFNLFANSAPESNAIGCHRDIGADLSFYDQCEPSIAGIIGFYVKSFAQGASATISGIDHNTDSFLATGTDLPRIRGNRAASVGSDVLDHQWSSAAVFDHKIMLYLSALEHRVEYILHLGDHRSGMILLRRVLFAWCTHFDGLPGRGPGGV